MPDIFLSPDQQWSDYHLVLSTTSGGIADGNDTNSATARLSRHGQASSGRPLIFSLSGHAQFSENGQQITVITDELGEATVYFIDTQPETVNVSCHYQQFRADTDSIFTQNVLSGLDISAEVLADNSPADGITRNSLRYSVYDQARRRVSGVTLLFSQNGNATLSNQNAPVSGYGQFTLTLTNRTAERVRVTANISGSLVSNYTYLTFSELPELILSSILLNNNVPADGTSTIRIIFTLTRGGVGVPDQYLRFQADAPTIRIAPLNGRTDQNGQIEVTVTSSRSGQNAVTAYGEAQSGILPVRVAINFTPLVIIYQVNNDGAPANGSAQNKLKFTVNANILSDPIPNKILRFTATNGATLSITQGATDTNGSLLLNLSNTRPGPVRVTAVLVADPGVVANIDMTFKDMTFI